MRIRWSLAIFLCCLGSCAGDSALQSEEANEDIPSPQETLPGEIGTETGTNLKMEILASATDLNLTGAAPLRFTLAPTTGHGGGLPTVLKTLGPGRQLFLVLRDLRAKEPPGVPYALYFNLPVGEEPHPRDPQHLGAINFFGAIPAKPGFYSFDLSRQVESLRDQGLLETPPTVTFVPLGTPLTGAEPVVGRAELVLQLASEESEHGNP